MSHSKKNTPHRPTRLDDLAYGCAAVVVAGLAVLSALAGCDPHQAEPVQRADNRASSAAMS